MSIGFTIGHENFSIFERARDALKTNMEKLVEMTRLYPVVCEFAGYRTVFRRRSDVEGLLHHVENEIRQWGVKHRVLALSPVCG